LLKLGLQFVKDDPVRYLLLSLDRIPEYFRFWPSADSGLISNVSRVSSFGLALPLMIVGIAIWLRNQKGTGAAAFLQSPGTLLLLFTLVYSGIHILSWALVRYRLPVDAVLVLYAALSVQYALDWLAAKQAAPGRPIHVNHRP
jgi:hypothetical protein